MEKYISIYSSSPQTPCFIGFDKIRRPPPEGAKLMIDLLSKKVGAATKLDGPKNSA